MAPSRDEQGGELVEWILVVGLIALVCIVSMGALGLKLTLRWNDVLNVM